MHIFILCNADNILTAYVAITELHVGLGEENGGQFTEHHTNWMDALHEIISTFNDYYNDGDAQIAYVFCTSWCWKSGQWSNNEKGHLLVYIDEQQFNVPIY